MSRNKSSYAEKHLPALTDDVVFSADFINNNKDLFNVIRSSHSFVDNFLQLPYQRQIALLDLFRNISNGNLIISPRNIKQTLLDLAYDELQQLHWMTGSSYEAGNTYYPIADDEKKLVRMECYGTIDARRDHELSPYYKFFNKPKNCGKFKLKDYDLQTSPMWRVFNQFEGFRSIAPQVRRYLYKTRINPDALKVMSVNDFCDVIHSIYAKNQQSMKARFLPIGYKNKFVMNFMRHCHKDLYNHLIARGIDRRKVASLCRSMKQYGTCDVDCITIMETHYTPRILNDLRANGYDVSNLKAGHPISEKMFQEVLSKDHTNLLLARDENGIPLDKDDLPRFEVHHKNAVKFAHSGDYLAKVNYFNNMMLVEKEIHRAYYHGYDQIIQVDTNNERYFSRINSDIPEMCFIDGFNTATDMFFYDLENNPSSRHRTIEDKQNVVNYYEMQFERLKNISVVADKYNIEYSKTDLNKEYKSLQELTLFKVDILADDVKQFEKWFNSKADKKHQNKINSHQPIMPQNNKGNER